MIYPPQPKGQFLIGHLNGFKTDPIQFMMDAAADHGDIVLFKLLHKKIYFLNHPDYVKHVLLTNHKNYHKSPGYKPLRLLGGMGIFTSDGEQWMKQRKLYQPAFSFDSIKSYSACVLENAEQLAKFWQKSAENGASVNVSKDMMKITMGIISETLFSNRIEFESHLWEAITYALEWINDRALKNPFVLPANWPTAKNRKFHASVAALNEVIYAVIAEKKRNNTNPTDLLSRFMNPGGELQGLNPTELRDEIMTIFIAGHETSANVLMWVFYELSRNEAIQERLAEEVKKLGNRSLNFEDLHQLEYTGQVLNETMRLYPPVWHLGRMNLAPDSIGGYELPAGSHVRMSPLVLHRHPDFWEDPNTFNPDRFSKEAIKSQDPYQFIPFGAGPRLCAGRNFAMMEMVLILATLSQKFKFSLLEDKKIEMGPLMTLRPKEDVILKLSLRGN